MSLNRTLKDFFQSVFVVKFPSQTDYQHFLLDRDKKVLMISNPSVHTALRQLYRRIILERDSINPGKKEESLAVLSRTTLPPALPTIRKEAAKVTN